MSRFESIATISSGVSSRATGNSSTSIAAILSSVCWSVSFQMYPHDVRGGYVPRHNQMERSMRRYCEGSRDNSLESRSRSCSMISTLLSYKSFVLV